MGIFSKPEVTAPGSVPPDYGTIVVSDLPESLPPELAPKPPKPPRSELEQRAQSYCQFLSMGTIDDEGRRERWVYDSLDARRRPNESVSNENLWAIAELVREGLIDVQRVPYVYEPPVRPDDPDDAYSFDLAMAREEANRTERATPGDSFLMLSTTELWRRWHQEEPLLPVRAAHQPDAQEPTVTIPAQPPPEIEWRANESKLFINGKLVKLFKDPAEKVRQVLDAFAAQNWDETISFTTHERVRGNLRKTISNLSKITAQSGVEFYSDGSKKRIGWRRLGS